MKYARYLVGLVCISIQLLHAEVIKEDTILYTQPGDKSAYKITIPIEFSPPSFEMSDGYMPVRFLATIDKYYGSNKNVSLIPGTRIYHTRFIAHELGIVLHDISVRLSPLYNEEFDKETTVEITGYVRTDDVRGGMFLEDNLNLFLQKGRFYIDSLNEHMVNYAYSKWYGGDSFISFGVSGDGVRDPSPRPRIVLFFYKNKLLAISHMRKYSFHDFIVGDGVRGEFVSYYIHNDNDNIIKRFKKFYKKLMTTID